ncbi:uncharacterized protein LOC134266647 [Saccostrea cucullata]|uniref:uncharacterized protein LOC134266647 n=1 Tax=Saccostrea cuccullata TaxID=36930 RepID=UPI002ED47B07
MSAMSRMAVIALTCTLVLLDVHGQYWSRSYQVSFSDNRRVYYHGDIIQCTGKRRIWHPFYRFSDRYEIADIDIVIQQYLTNGTRVELTSCPFSDGYRCSAHLIDDGCREVNVACSVTKNETEFDKISREIVMTSRPSIKAFHIHYKNVSSDNYTQVFPTGSLIELICSGD